MLLKIALQVDLLGLVETLQVQVVALRLGGIFSDLVDFVNCVGELVRIFEFVFLGLNVVSPQIFITW